MSLTYNKDYFMSSDPNISGNEELRIPQVDAYYEVYRHFMINKKTTSAIVVLPTGTGKTGLMGLLPYYISEGRVLIITPQLTIKDSVIDSLDPEKPDNFWLKRKVFNRIGELPALIEYEGMETNQEALESANIVVLNIHKLQKRLSTSPLNFLHKEFFDMILIDEAHHSTARTWVDTVNHFSKAKVVKLTGTPFRSDNEKIAGELVYKYKLSQAMSSDYVKSLENIKYVPDKLLLTIDNDLTKTYTVEEIYEKELKDEDWVSRSVAYAPECSKKIVDESIKLLKEKLSNSNVPHKIIAVACGIEHANQIKDMYELLGYKTAIIHSKMEEMQKEKAFNDIKNHRVQVVVNVAMLGEGYDHPYLSIAAIFRPFRNRLPYAQFIGRILRTIPKGEIQSALDNIGQIISHKHLYLDDLWKYYKEQIQESEIIKYIKEQESESELDLETKNGSQQTYNQDRTIGVAKEIGDGNLTTDTYLNTELIRKYKEEQKLRDEKLEELQKILNIDRDKALSLLNQSESEKSPIKRPDKYFARRKKDIDVRIKEEIVPHLIIKHNIDKQTDELRRTSLFRYKYGWIPGFLEKKSTVNNASLLAVYFINYLNNEIGKKKKEWNNSDYDIAYEKLDQVVDYVDKILEEFITDLK
jgi:superfamily II DNA or RNA helicase